MDNKKMKKLFYDKINELLEYKKELYKYEDIVEQMINLCENHINLMDLYTDIEKEKKFDER